MRSRRVERVEKLILAEISRLILREIKDPRIGFVTLTGVKLTNDLQHATVFISVLGEDEDKNRTLQGLKSASGFIRGEVGKRIRLKTIPEIIFKIDHSIEHALRIDQLLREINQ